MSCPAPDLGFSWNAVSAIAAAIAAIAAAIAAWLSRGQLKAAEIAAEISADAAQIQVFENIFHDIQRREENFYGSARPSPEEKALRDRMFFNTVNHLAFLVDSKILRKAEFLDYYRDALLYWWTLFEKEVPDVDRNDPSKYEEFKRVVADFKNPSPSFRSL